MPTTVHTFEPQPPLVRLRETAIAVLVGCGIGFVLWLGDANGSLLVYVVLCAWIGLAIHVCATLLCRLFRPFYGRLEGLPLRAALGAVFFVAGASGFYLGAWSADLFLVGVFGAGLQMEGSENLLLSLAFPGMVGLVVGLAFFSYETLQARLAESAERIREQEWAERELETARAIQRRLLPPAEVEGAGYRIAARNLPARAVAGDFYDVLPDLPGSGVASAGRDGGPGREGAIGLVVADVSGKGMGASLVTASVKTMLSFVAPGRPVAEVLSELNRRLASELGAREFVALCFARFHPATGEVEVANAGLPDPYVLGPLRGDSAQRPRPLPVPGPRLPLGVRPEVAYGSVRTTLAPGERLLLVSDGLPEALTEGDEPIGYARFETLLADDGADAGAGAELGAWLDGVLARLEAETRSARDDDWTALALERRPAVPEPG